MRPESASVKSPPLAVGHSPVRPSENSLVFQCVLNRIFLFEEPKPRSLITFMCYPTLMAKVKKELSLPPRTHTPSYKPRMLRWFVLSLGNEPFTALNDSLLSFGCASNGLSASSLGVRLLCLLLEALPLSLPNLSSSLLLSYLLWLGDQVTKPRLT